MLELLSLLEPELLVSLDSMRSSWRTYLALWVPNRTRAHIERLGDIIEIIISDMKLLELLVSLNSMRSSWRTYLTLWVPSRTRAHTKLWETS